MKKTFLLVATLICGLSVNGIAQSKESSDLKNPVKTETTRESAARQQQGQVDGFTLNEQIEAKKKEITEIEEHLRKKSTDPDYNPSATKMRLEQARQELKELKNKTL